MYVFQGHSRFSKGHFAWKLMNRLVVAGFWSIFMALVFLFFPGETFLFAQTFQLDQTEKKNPTPRDPRYNDPVIPPQFRNKNTLEPASGLLLNPTGEIDMESMLRSRQSQDSNRERAKAELRIRRYDDIPEDKKRVILQKSILRQFGVDDFPHSWRGELPYTETPVRRFQITFFLSLPVTMSLSYGLLSLSHMASDQSTRAYSAGETISMVVLGVGLSSWVAWYDLERYREKTAPSNLDDAPEHGENEQSRFYHRDRRKTAVGLQLKREREKTDGGAGAPLISPFLDEIRLSYPVVRF